MKPREREQFAAFYDAITSDIDAMRNLENLYPDKSKMPEEVKRIISQLIRRCIIDTMVNWVAEEPLESDMKHYYVYDRGMNGKSDDDDGIEMNYVYITDEEGNRIAVENIGYDPYCSDCGDFCIGAWKTNYNGLKTNEEIDRSLYLDELPLSSQKKLLHDMLLPLCSFYEPCESFESWDVYETEKNNMYFRYLRNNLEL